MSNSLTNAMNDDSLWNGKSSADSTAANQPSLDYGSIFGFSSDDATRPVIISKATHPMGPVSGDYLTKNATPGTTYSPTLRADTSTWQNYFDSVRNSVRTDPGSFKDLQSRLYAGGFYKPYLNKGETPNFGRMDKATVSALNDMIGEAVVSGRSVDETIDGAKDQNTGAAKSTTRLTNPADIAANAQQAAFKTTGKPIDPATLAQIQANAESTAQQTFNSSDGANVYSFSPSEAWLQQQIQQLAPQATQAFSTFQGENTLQSLLGSANSPIGNLYHG